MQPNNFSMGWTDEKTRVQSGSSVYSNNLHPWYPQQQRPRDPAVMQPNPFSTGWTDEKTRVQSHSSPYSNNLHPWYTQQQQQQQQQGNGNQPQYWGAGQQPYPRGQQPAKVVTAQPSMYVTEAPPADPVNDYFFYSVFTLMCCCLPLGIAALVYSIATRDANNTGNREAAERSSKKARILNHVALGLGIGIITGAIICVVVMAATLTK